MVATRAMTARRNGMAGVKKVLPLYPTGTEAGREPSPKGLEEGESRQEAQNQSGGSSA